MKSVFSYYSLQVSPVIAYAHLHTRMRENFEWEKDGDDSDSNQAQRIAAIAFHQLMYNFY